MQIKTTWKYHLTPVRMAIIKKSTSNNAGEGVGKKESSFPSTLLVRMQTGVKTSRIKKKKRKKNNDFGFK